MPFAFRHPTWGQIGDSTDLVLGSRLLSPPEQFDGEGQSMASLEYRGNRYRVAFRLGGQKFQVAVKAKDTREAEACLARLEENLRLVERVG